MTAARQNDPRNRRWHEMHWTAWAVVDEVTVKRGAIPRVRGVYRVRAPGVEGLVYIGISESLAGRLRSLRRARDRPDHVGHYAGACVAAVQRKRGALEVSWCALPDVDRRELLGIECDLIAAHRTAMGSSPTCQFAGVA